MKLKTVERFYKINSKFYDATRWAFLFSRQRAISLLDIKEEDKVLDLACGTGLNIPHLTKKTNVRNITGIDFSESMLEVARKKHPAVKFVNGDVATYDFERRFDKITSTYSLSLIEDWEKTIRNAGRHLKRDGEFLILDFHRWRGIIRPLYPAFREWLSFCGVDSDRDYLPELERNFGEVERHVFNSGYNSAMIARNPIDLSK